MQNYSGVDTKREKFLGEMDAVVPWAPLLALIAPYYPKAGNGRRPYPLEVMLRIYFLQQWYQLSDPGAEEALYDIQSMRGFAGLELGHDAIPDETTILNFRRLLERHDLTKALFEVVSRHIEDKGALLRGGTIMDATLIAASPSTKNKDSKRDPEMSQSKKGNQWYFGMKAHIGVDARSGLVHTADVTTGKVHDAKVMDNLIREDDRAVFGDKGYVNEKKKQAARPAGVYWAVKDQRKPGRQLSASQKKRNRRHGRVRAKNNTHAIGDGMQQALGYAETLAIPFVFSSNSGSGMAGRKKRILFLADPELLGKPGVARQFECARAVRTGGLSECVAPDAS